MKKTVSLLLALVLLLSFVPVLGLANETVPVVCNIKELADFAYNNGSLTDGLYIVRAPYDGGSAGWMYDPDSKQLILCNTIYREGGHTFTTVSFDLEDGLVQDGSVFCGFNIDNGAYYAASAYIDRANYKVDEELHFVCIGDAPVEIMDSIVRLANNDGIAMFKCVNAAMKNLVGLNLGDLGFTSFVAPTYKGLKTGHSFGNWVVEKEATTKEKGIKKRTCSECGLSETQDIPKKKESDDSSHPHSADCPSVKFIDVDKNESQWTHKPIDYVLTKGYMTGVSVSKFEPEKTVSRSMVVQVLYAMEGKPTVFTNAGFKDVVKGKWYSDAVNWAAANGIVAGYDNGHFGINDSVKRQDLIAIMYKYALYKKYDSSLNGDISKFADKASISSYAVNGMRWGVGHGIISGIKKGSVTNAEPKSTATRAQLAVILKAFDEYIKK